MLKKENRVRVKKEKDARERQDKNDVKAQLKLRQEEKKKSKKETFGDEDHLIGTRESKREDEAEDSDKDLKEVASRSGRP